MGIRDRPIAARSPKSSTKSSGTTARGRQTNINKARMVSKATTVIPIRWRPGIEVLVYPLDLKSFKFAHSSKNRPAGDLFELSREPSVLALSGRTTPY